MIIRVWRTKIDSTRMPEYERFAQEQSLPMFRGQPGCVGVLFAGGQEDRAALSMWRDLASVEALAHSATYQETVEQLNATGVLVGATSVEAFEVQGGFLDLQALAELVKGATTR